MQKTLKFLFFLPFQPGDLSLPARVVSELYVELKCGQRSIFQLIIFLYGRFRKLRSAKSPVIHRSLRIRQLIEYPVHVKHHLQVILKPDPRRRTCVIYDAAHAAILKSIYRYLEVAGRVAVHTHLCYRHKFFLLPLFRAFVSLFSLHFLQINIVLPSVCNQYIPDRLQIGYILSFFA